MSTLFGKVKESSIFKKLILLVLLAILLAPVTQTALSGTMTNVGVTNNIIIYPIADSYVDKHHPTSNYGSNDTMEVGNSTDTSQLEQRAYLKFDLSSIPSNAVITLAQLLVYPWHVTETQNIGVHYCSDNSWTETGITWNSQPSYSAAPADSKEISTPNWCNWNVTSQVLVAFDSAQKRLTLVLVCEESLELAYVDFYSRDQSDPSYMDYIPALVVSITPSETNPPSVTDLTPTNGSFVTTKTPTISANYSDPSGIDTNSVVLYVGGYDVTSSSVIGSTGVSYTPTSDQYGTINVRLEVSDWGGNKATTEWFFTADSTPPEIRSASPSNGSTVNTSTPTISASFYDSAGAAAIDTSSFVLKIDSSPVTATVTSSGFSYVPASPLSDGNHTVYVSIQDKVGLSTSETWSFTVQVPQPSRCFIATATYGSEAAPQVQFLREFRDSIAMQTFAGSSFMNVFLGWYYSWSPPVAYSIAPNDGARAVMRVALQPLLDILQLSAGTYSALSFNSEFGIVMAGFVAATLIGLVYFMPFTTLALLGAKRLKRNLTLPSAKKALHFVAIPWIASIVLIIIAELVLAPVLMMIATAAFVIVTIVLAVSTTSLLLTSLYKRD